MNENQDLESALRESAEMLDYCASLIRDHNIEPVKENVRKIATALAEVSDIMLLFKSFQEEMKEPWEHRCSFCKKKQNKVNKLIQGPGVLICDNCVNICNEILKSNTELNFQSEV